MVVLVKLAGADYSTAELVCYRGIVGCVAIASYAAWKAVPLRTAHLGAHLARSVSGTIALSIWFYAMTVLPLATAITFNYTSPLWIALITIALLRERHGFALPVAIAVGFAGVVLLLQPTVSAGQTVAGLVGVASGALSAVAFLSVRKLGALGEPEWRVVFYFSLVSAVGAGLWMLAFGAHALTPRGVALLLGVGVSALLAQLALTRAFARGQTLLASNLSFSTVVFGALFGLAVWGEMPTAAGWAGMVLIVTSGVLATLAARRRAARP
jgi:S-adenosylmethionine uptake transporter